eukprot:ANDGO_04744.mRNA.1 General stress protein 39
MSSAKSVFAPEMPQEHQDRMPGLQYEMHQQPHCDAPWYKGSLKLKDKVALITGGDSGIGRSVAVLFAREGANIAIVYLSTPEDDDANETKRLVEKEGSECLVMRGDLGDKVFAAECVQKTVQRFQKLNVLVNNCSIQLQQKVFEDITEEQMMRVFRSNVFSYFFLA